MKKTLSLVLTVVFLFSVFSVCAFASSGTTYYIDSVAGNDSNLGTSESAPWKTAENVRTVSLNAGDKVLFKCDGIYTVETLTLTCKGTSENRIEIASYGKGARPLLTTQQRCDVLHLLDCSYVTVKDLEITAPNGGGIWVYTEKEVSEGVTLDNLKIHNIQNHTVTSRDSQSNPTDARACVMVKHLGYPATKLLPVNDFTCTNCEMYDCGNGLLLWGSFTADSNSPWDDNDEDDVSIIYNQNVFVSGCQFHDMDAEGMIIGMCDNSLITDCTVINCCQGLGMDENGNQLYYTAPIWFWGGLRTTVQNCEVAGAKNHGDGMCCDFDSWTNYCTYQYMYSHDNNTFVCNCPYGSGQTGNCVRYCLSVNDNGIRNTLCGSRPEKNFKFYNNTLINCSDIHIQNLKNGFVANNIFVGDLLHSWYCNNSETGFNGTFTNNCIWGMGTPLCSENDFVCDPGFVGDDESNPDSYRLSKDSALLGKGVKVDDGLTVDFYGNPLGEKANIGCYGGLGEDAETSVNMIDEFIRSITSLLGTIYQKISDVVNMLFG